MATSNFNGIDYIVVHNLLIVVSESVESWTIFDCEGFVIEDCEYGMISQSCGDYSSTFYAMLALNGAGLDTIYNCFEDTSPCISNSNNYLIKASIEIYPNPSSGFVMLKGEFTSSIPFQMYNANGQLVNEGKITDRSIDISSHENGLYFIKIWIRPHKSQVLRFVKI